MNIGSDKKLSVVWLAPYPLHLHQNDLVWARTRLAGHSCSWVVNLARALVARPDIELQIVTLCAGVSTTQSFTHTDGYKVHVVKCGIPWLHRGFPSYAPLDAYMGYHFERSSLVKKVCEISPDLVHAHGTEYAYGLAAMDAKIPWVVSVQGIITDYLRTNPCLLYRYVSPLENQVLRAARYVGGRTHYDKGYVSNVNPNATLLDMPEAMNDCFFAEQWKDVENRRIVFVGNCEPRKGLRRLIEALGIISREYPDMALEVVGGSSQKQREEIMEMARSLKITLNFHGYMNSREIAALHRECCCFVIPSENENSPNTLAEAMASGMPCVAYDTGGIASMIEDDVSGLLVRFGDAKRLAHAISEIFTDKELRNNLSKNARQHAERNRPGKVAEVTRGAYQKIIKDWDSLI